MAGVSEDAEVQNEGREALEANLSDETRKLAQMGRGEEVPVDTGDDDKGDDDRPAWLPEKFKTAEDFAKSYAELEKKLGGGKSDDDDTDEETPLKVGQKKPKEEAKPDGAADDVGEDDKDDEGEDKLPDFSSETVQTAISDVAAQYATSGELTADMRKMLTDVGISDELIDTHMRGVKVQERLMRQEVFEIAGGEEVYGEAVEWARDNWSEDEITAFDQSLEKDKLRAKAVKALIAEYREANPGEGKLTSVKGGMDRGSVYTSHEEFQQDLAKAGDNQVEREKVIAKLRRSRKAGSIKSQQSASPFIL